MIRSLTCLLFAAFFVGGCATSLTPEQKAQRERIAQEPRGDWWIGRRFHLLETRLWGYVRRPGFPWEKSRLVIMNEKFQTIPDRLMEEPEEGWAHGYDHNCEYRIWGSYSGETAYDPNSDLNLPEFLPTKFELISRRPGFILKPGDSVNQEELPRWY